MNINADFGCRGVWDWYDFVGTVEKLGSSRWESQMETLLTSIMNVVFQEESGAQCCDGEEQQEVSALFKHLWGIPKLNLGDIFEQYHILLRNNGFRNRSRRCRPMWNLRRLHNINIQLQGIWKKKQKLCACEANGSRVGVWWEVTYTVYRN